jgi:hypothetical protein
MLKFEVGKVYTGRFATDSDCTYSFEVLFRTEKRIQIVDAHTSALKWIGVKLDHNGNEMALPFGRYSMAPTIRADRFE